jgi:CO/xanthine dehydrogenase Mo-binding subunit
MTQAKTDFKVLGKPRKIIDGREKITGRARYTGDLVLPGMLHARPVLSPYAHANITSIDIEAALDVPGVFAVLTAQDLPTRDRVINSRHSAVLAREKVLWRGQPVVVVVAETEAAAQDGADVVLVDYEPLPVVADMESAQSPDAFVVWPNGLPKEGMDLTAAHAAVDHGEAEDQEAPPNVHAQNHFKRGDVAKGFAEADVVVERTYKVPVVHQGYMEPCATVADPDRLREQITVYTGTQGQFGIRDEIARLLSLPKRQVRVVAMTLGGGFGAKYGIIDALAASTAWAINRPVKLVLTRSEDFLTSTPSPAVSIDVKIGATRDGKLTALQARATLDNGVFPFTIGGIFGTLFGGYYKCDNVQIDCAEVFTNKPQAGAYRAPGSPQATFALEATVDDIARELGMDALEFRLKNVAEDGDPMGNGDPWPSIGARQCLERIREHPAWQNRANLGPNEGVGIALGGWPCGMSPAAAFCRVDNDGTVRVEVGSVDISGVNSTFVLIAAEILGVSPDQVEIIQGDTTTGPFAGPSGGSQTTYSVSGAVASAAREVRERLLELAADEFEASAADLEIVDGQVRVKGVPAQTKTIGELAAKAERTRGGPGPVIGNGRAAVEENGPGFVAQLARVAVDTDTGEVTIKQYVTVQDVGFAMNPMLVEGQIHGGTVQSIGWAMGEAMVYDENGQLLTATFMDYDLPKADRVPPIEAIIVENPSPMGPFGVRGVGEPPITAALAAISNAIRDATGTRVTETPFRAETVWKALHNGQA